MAGVNVAGRSELVLGVHAHCALRGAPRVAVGTARVRVHLADSVGVVGRHVDGAVVVGQVDARAEVLVGGEGEAGARVRRQLVVREGRGGGVHGRDVIGRHTEVEDADLVDGASEVIVDVADPVVVAQLDAGRGALGAARRVQLAVLVELVFRPQLHPHDVLVCVDLCDREVLLQNTGVARAGLAGVPVQALKACDPHRRRAPRADPAVLVANEGVPAAGVRDRGLEPQRERELGVRGRERGRDGHVVVAVELEGFIGAAEAVSNKRGAGDGAVVDAGAVVDVAREVVVGQSSVLWATASGAWDAHRPLAGGPPARGDSHHADVVDV